MDVLCRGKLAKINPLDMATDIFKRRYGGEAMRGLLETVIGEVER